MSTQSLKTRRLLGLQQVLVAILVIGTSLASVLVTRPANGQTISWIEFVGTIAAASGSTITVDSLQVDVSKAEVKIALTVGRVVKVEGYLLSPAKVQATEVKAPKVSADDDENELVGRLDARDAGTMRIAGLLFNTQQAEIKGNLVIGMQVKVHYRLLSGVRVAREVEPFVPGDDDDDDMSKVGEVETVGTISQTGSGFIVVNGTRIITTGAEIKVALRVGLRVKVHMRFTGIAFVAREIEAALAKDKKSDDDSDDKGKSDDDDSSGKGSDDQGGDKDNSGKGGDDGSSGGGDDSGGDDDSGSDDSNDDNSGGDDSGNDDSDDDDGGDDDGDDD